MSKEELNARQKLINAGIILARQKGISSFSVRQLCLKAKVNLGLFHYHFISRQKFNKAVLKELYGNFLKDFDFKSSGDLTPLQELENISSIIGNFTKENASLLSSLFIEVASGNKEMVSFIQNNFTRHIEFIISVIERCKAQKILKNYDTLVLLFSFIAPIALPNVAVSIVKKIMSKKDYQKAAPFMEKIASDKLTKERIEISLKGALR
ncbi:MAG: TetR family transcriptional regulator [Elusimicrobiota bacterium]|jgi:AcrR family transcriptional regulator|nr:TetR family transcriptional regulator [Elusimicrobiota bacterium]